MKKTMVMFILLAVLTFSPLTANAWDSTGHSVVAQIAWDNMNAATKRKIIEILRHQPRPTLLNPPSGGNPSNINSPLNAEFFQTAATWPDRIRGIDELNHSIWHFRDLFWNASDNSNSTKTPHGDLIEKLIEFSGNGSDEDKAIQIAWLEHLIGDIHQPLHCSGRITDEPDETDGDNGGNDFCLVAKSKCGKKGALKLHTYWDHLLSNGYKQNSGESDYAYNKRLADYIAHLHPRSEFSDLAAFDGTDKWLTEGRDKANAYPASLKRNVAPNNNYRKDSLKIAQEAIAEAGYRLAKTLEERFSN
jgi:hypothetical protein